MNRGRESGPEASGAVSTIGPGLRVIGDCITDGAIHVDGLVEGSIKAREVVVEEGGRVQGNIQTRDAVVAGQVSGNIACAGRAAFTASCRVAGDILSPRIHIEEGGRIDGRLQMSVEPTKAAAGPAKPAAGPAKPADEPQK